MAILITNLSHKGKRVYKKERKVIEDKMIDIIILFMEESLTLMNIYLAS